MAIKKKIHGAVSSVSDGAKKVSRKIKSATDTVTGRAVTARMLEFVEEYGTVIEGVHDATRRLSTQHINLKSNVEKQHGEVLAQLSDFNQNVSRELHSLAARLDMLSSRLDKIGTITAKSEISALKTSVKKIEATLSRRSNDAPTPHPHPSDTRVGYLALTISALAILIAFVSAIQGAF